MLRKRIFAYFYHQFNADESGTDDFTERYRIPLIAQARGRVLEIGAGDGGNLRFYPPGVDLTLLEPNPFMMTYLRERVAARGLQAELVEAPGEALPFAEASFDTVLTTHVLCSVGEPERVLAEVRRVLRPGGRFLFLEHVADEPGTLVHGVQRAINPAWRWAGDGCHLTRDTAASIRAAGFRQVTIQPFKADWGIVAPHIYGSAEA